MREVEEIFMGEKENQGGTEEINDRPRDIPEIKVDPPKENSAFQNQIQKYLPFISMLGIFTVLSYLLGRLHIELYYSALGITTNVLKFDLYDYMFSSFNSYIMCLAITVCIYATIWRFRSEKKINAKAEITIIVYSFIFFLFSGIYLVLLYFIPEIYTPGFSGLIIGIFFGFTPYIYYSDVYVCLKQKHTIGLIKKVQNIGMLVFAIIIISLLPYLTETFAQSQATKDMNNFPAVNVVCNDTLLTYDQDLSENISSIIKGKLIITNNGMTYVMSENFTENWQVYSIPVENIKEITYFHDEK
jgi:hypothetical protein